MNNNMIPGNVPYQSAVIHNKQASMVESGASMILPNQYISSVNPYIHDREIGMPIYSMGPNQQGLMTHNPNGHIVQNRNRSMIQNPQGPIGSNPNLYIGQMQNGSSPQSIMVQNPHGLINPNMHSQITPNQHGTMHLNPHGVMSQIGPEMYYRARSNAPYPFTECMINEFNRRLQERTEASDNDWWDVLITDFFEEDAILNVTFADDRPRKFGLCRAIIPRYFRTIFDSDCSEYFYYMRSVKTSCIGSTIISDSESALMIMSFPHSIPSLSVTVEGRLVIVFNNNESMRIKSWTFDIRNSREYILKTIAGPNENCKTIDMHCGIPNFLLTFLNFTSGIQELFPSESKLACQHMTAPAESTRKIYKRKKPKDSSTILALKPKKSPSQSQSNTSQSSDVIVVGEPILMGDEYIGADERSITRLEQIQLDNSANSKTFSKSPNMRNSNCSKLIRSGSVSSINSQQSGVEQKPYFNSNTPDTKNSDLSPMTN